VHQRPSAWKARKHAMDEVLTNDGALTRPLGNWMDNHHIRQEWYLARGTKSMWRHEQGKWTKHTAAHFGRLWFGSCCTESAAPPQQELTQVVEISQQPRCTSVKDKAHIGSPREAPPPAPPPHPIQYQSTLGESLPALPCHVQHMVGHIPATYFPSDWDIAMLPTSS
jgi:hypothetical protein